MLKNFSKFSLIAASVFALSISALAAEKKTVLSVADGMPKLAEVIGEESFVPVEVEKLKNSKVWFVDYEWHRQHGIDVPANGIQDPEFAKQILEAYGWQSRGVEDHDGQYTGEKKNWFTDYYGGFGMGYNYGSGRAAAMGLVQAKGTRTNMVKSTDAWHSNGAVQSIEAVDEAIWSQVLDSEMTYGSNKVVAVILTGTYATMKDTGQVFPRALIIREMAPRPAHWQLNYSRDSVEDRARVEKIMPTLVKSLPQPEGYTPKNEEDAIRSGFLEHVRREAKAQAEYYAKRLFFGSTSPSNVEINGRRLDLGDHTALEGYSRVYRVNHSKSFGWFHGETAASEYVFNDMIKSYKRTLPANLALALPSTREVTEYFRQQFEKERQVEFAKLSGAPAQLVEKLRDSFEVKQFGELVFGLARNGNQQEQFTDPNGWENLGNFNMNKMLSELAFAGDDTEKMKQIFDQNTRDQHRESFAPLLAATRDGFVKAYVNFKNKMIAQARVDGVSAAALNEYMKITARAKNKTLTNLIRGHRRWREMWDTTDLGITGDGKIVENYIEDQTSKSITTYKDLAPYQALIRNEENRAQGVTLREVFDAQTGRVSTIVKVSTSSGHVHFKDVSMSADEMKNVVLDIDGSHMAKASAFSDAVEFHFDGLSGVTLNKVNVRKGNVVPIKTEDKKEKNETKLKVIGECRAVFAK